MPKKKTAGHSSAGAEAAAKKPRAAKAAAAPKAAAAAALIIDYPLEGEIVVSPSYTFRLTASEPQRVEVAVDGGNWSQARESVGNWWFDWTGYQSGGHTLEVRMKTKGGRTVKAKPRQFTVII